MPSFVIHKPLLTACLFEHPNISIKTCNVIPEVPAVSPRYLNALLEVPPGSTRNRFPGVSTIRSRECPLPILRVSLTDPREYPQPVSEYPQRHSRWVSNGARDIGLGSCRWCPQQVSGGTMNEFLGIIALSYRTYGYRTSGIFAASSQQYINLHPPFPRKWGSVADYEYPPQPSSRRRVLALLRWRTVDEKEKRKPLTLFLLIFSLPLPPGKLSGFQIWDDCLCWELCFRHWRYLHDHLPDTGTPKTAGNSKTRNGYQIAGRVETRRGNSCNALRKHRPTFCCFTISLALEMIFVRFCSKKHFLTFFFEGFSIEQKQVLSFLRL